MLGQPQRHLQVVILLLSAALLGSFVLAAWSFYSAHRQAERNQDENRATWHAVICATERATLRNPFLSPDAVRGQVFFLDRILVDQVHTAACGLKLPKGTP